MSEVIADLIKRLECADGEELYLDVEIAQATGWFTANPSCHRAPDFTSSIDAALTLVPEGGRVREIGQWDDNGRAGGWFAHITRWVRTPDGWDSRSFTYGIQDPMDFHPKIPPLAPNGAIAICIAALKATGAAR